MSPKRLQNSSRNTKPRVLVTGASGFLGKTVVPLLIKHGYTVETVGRSEQPFTGVKHYVADIAVVVPKAAVLRADAIVHLAGDVRIGDSLAHPRTHIQENLSMTLNMLEACRESNRQPLFIFLSTDRVYGKAKTTVTETSPTFPVEPYVAAKLMSETAIATYGHLLSMPYVIVRASAFFGPHQPRRGFIADVICKMLEQDTITVGPLKGVKNFTSVQNVADAILAALKAKTSAHNRIYNIGGAPHSLQEILTITRGLLEKSTGRTIRVQTDPSIKIPDKHDIGPFTLKTAEAKKYLTWKERTSLKVGLEETIAYFRRTLKNPNKR